jgi:iron(III) transport system ATP-binding protein
MSCIAVRDLWFGYGRTPVLEDVSLDLAEHQILALIGPSGCGKTTLLRLLAGFERPERGTVSLDGKVVAGPGRFVPTNRRRVGIVPQEGALFPHLDVARNIAFGLGRGGERSPRVAEMVAVAGLAGLEHRFPRELSGGQQQRVALARALAPRPAVVLLDEPFASLDTALRAPLRAEVRAMLSREGATAVLVTHDREEALSTADRLAVMIAGRVVQQGTPEDVYDLPATAAAAGLLGQVTLLPVLGHEQGGRVRTALGLLDVAAGCQGSVAVVRPEQVVLDVDGTPAEVVSGQFTGPGSRVHLRLGDDTRLEAWLRERPRVGDQVRVAVRTAVALVPGSSRPPTERSHVAAHDGSTSAPSRV